MARTIEVDLGGNITLIVQHTNPADEVEIRADYTLNCGEDGEMSKSISITLPPGLEVQQKNIIKNFVIPQIVAVEQL